MWQVGPEEAKLQFEDFVGKLRERAAAKAAAKVRLCVRVYVWGGRECVSYALCSYAHG